MTIVSKEFPSTNRLPQIASEAAGAYHVPHQMLTGHPSASQEVAAKLLKVRTLYLLFFATKIQHSLEVKELHKAIGTLSLLFDNTDIILANFSSLNTLKAYRFMFQWLHYIIRQCTSIILKKFNFSNALGVHKLQVRC